MKSKKNFWFAFTSLFALSSLSFLGFFKCFYPHQQKEKEQLFIQTFSASEYFGNGCAGEFTLKFTNPNSCELINVDKFSAWNLNFGYGQFKSNDTIYTITSIGENVFENNKDIKGKLTIPKTIEKIGKNAFANCTNISEIEIEGVMNYLNYTENMFENVKPIKFTIHNKKYKNDPKWNWKDCNLECKEYTDKDYEDFIYDRTFNFRFNMVKNNYQGYCRGTAWIVNKVDKNPENYEYWVATNNHVVDQLYQQNPDKFLLSFEKNSTNKDNKKDLSNNWMEIDKTDIKLISPLTPNTKNITNNFDFYDNSWKNSLSIDFAIMKINFKNFILKSFPISKGGNVVISSKYISSSKYTFIIDNFRKVLENTNGLNNLVNKYNQLVNNINSTMEESNLQINDIDSYIKNHISLFDLISKHLNILNLKKLEKNNVNYTIKQAILTLKLVEKLKKINNVFDEKTFVNTFRTNKLKKDSLVYIAGFPNAKNGYTEGKWCLGKGKVIEINQPIKQSNLDYVLVKSQPDEEWELTHGSSGSMVIDSDFNVVAIYWGNYEDDISDGRCAILVNDTKNYIPLCCFSDDKQSK